MPSTPKKDSQKAPDAFRTISEVSEELDIPQHVLRFWEAKFTIVKPLKRGGGRRYYRPADVEIIRGIRDLLYTHGFTIKGAQKLLKEQGGRIENIDVLASGGVLTRDGKSSVVTAVSTDETGAAAPVNGQNELKAVLEELQAIRRLLPR